MCRTWKICYLFLSTSLGLTLAARRDKPGSSTGAEITAPQLPKCVGNEKAPIEGCTCGKYTCTEGQYCREAKGLDQYVLPRRMQWRVLQCTVLAPDADQPLTPARFSWENFYKANYDHRGQLVMAVVCIIFGHMFSAYNNLLRIRMFVSDSSPVPMVSLPDFVETGLGKTAADVLAKALGVVVPQLFSLLTTYVQSTAQVEVVKRANRKIQKKFYEAAFFQPASYYDKENGSLSRMTEMSSDIANLPRNAVGKFADLVTTLGSLKWAYKEMGSKAFVAIGVLTGLTAFIRRILSRLLFGSESLGRRMESDGTTMSENIKNMRFIQLNNARGEAFGRLYRSVEKRENDKSQQNKNQEMQLNESMTTHQASSAINLMVQQGGLETVNWWLKRERENQINTLFGQYSAPFETIIRPIVSKVLPDRYSCMMADADNDNSFVDGMNFLDSAHTCKSAASQQITGRIISITLDNVSFRYPAEPLKKIEPEAKPRSWMERMMPCFFGKQKQPDETSAPANVEEIATKPKWAVRKLSLTFDIGKVHVLLGPSGCGKSTLLSLALGRFQPIEGRVSLRWDGSSETASPSATAASSASKSDVGTAKEATRDTVKYSEAAATTSKKPAGKTIVKPKEHWRHTRRVKITEGKGANVGEGVAEQGHASKPVLADNPEEPSSPCPKASGSQRGEAAAADIDMEAFNQTPYGFRVMVQDAGETSMWKASMIENVIFHKHPELTMHTDEKKLKEIARSEEVKEALRRACILDEIQEKYGEQDLAQALSRNADLLSGGQKTRLMLARAIYGLGKGWLIMDEPIANIDPRNRQKVIQLMKQLVEEGVTIIVITHDSSIGSQLHNLQVPHRITMLREPKDELGSLVEAGTHSELLARPAGSDVGTYRYFVDTLAAEKEAERRKKEEEDRRNL